MASSTVSSFVSDHALFEFVVKNGNGVKGLADSGIKKVPERYIQPPSERTEKTINPALIAQHQQYSSVPIDLSKLDGPEHDQVAEAIVRAAETFGFFQVINHGMDLELLQSLKDTAHLFFAQPPEAKAVYLKGVSPSPRVTYGTSFSPEKEKSLEWKDYISMVYTNDAEAQKYWPKECKEESLEYLKLSSNLARKLLEVLTSNLGVKLDDSRLDSLTGFKMVNMNFYPACPNPDLTIGVGRHSDLGILTVLLQDGIGGLYVKVELDLETGRKEDWVEIPPIPGALVINIGDSLQILSNGKYISAEHRVRTTSKQSRVSVPVFIIPQPTEKIAPFPHLAEKDGGAFYREVVFQDYMTNFFSKPHQGKKSLDFAKI